MPVTNKEVREFERRIRALQREASAITSDVRGRVMNIVDDHRRRIKELIDTYPAKEPLPSGAIPKLSAQINAEVNAMITETSAVISEAQQSAFTAGIEAGKQVAAAINLEGAFFGPSPELIRIATGYTAELVRSIESELMPKVNAELSRAVLGGQSPYEAMQGIDKLIGRNAERGVSFQAERIVRTEVSRVYNIALDQQVNEVISQLDNPKGVLKEWVSGPWRPGRREAHQQMDGVKVPVDEPFTLPSGVRLDYPGALGPSNAPEETINCGCTWRIAGKSLLDAL